MGISCGCHEDDHMTIKMTATEAKARILALLDDVAAGQVPTRSGAASAGSP